jgi:hypothetical protein
MFMIQVPKLVIMIVAQNSESATLRHWQPAHYSSDATLAGGPGVPSRVVYTVQKCHVMARLTVDSPGMIPGGFPPGPSAPGPVPAPTRDVVADGPSAIGTPCQLSLSGGTSGRGHCSCRGNAGARPDSVGARGACQCGVWGPDSEKGNSRAAGHWPPRRPGPARSREGEPPPAVGPGPGPEEGVEDSEGISAKLSHGGPRRRAWGRPGDTSRVRLCQSVAGRGLGGSLRAGAGPGSVSLARARRGAGGMPRTGRCCAWRTGTAGARPGERVGGHRDDGAGVAGRRRPPGRRAESCEAPGAGSTRRWWGWRRCCKGRA